MKAKNAAIACVLCVVFAVALSGSVNRLFAQQKPGASDGAAFEDDIAASGPANERLKAYAPFMGLWDTESRFVWPDGKELKAAGQSHTGWILGGQFGMNRIISGIEGSRIETVWVFTFDREAKVLREWSFSSNKLQLEFESTWDESTSTMTTRSVKTRKGYQMTAWTKLIDADKAVVTLKVEDDRRERPVETTTQLRVKDPSTMGAFRSSKKFKPGRTELKVLQPMIGKWIMDSTVEPGKYLPAGGRYKGAWSAKWVLGGHFMRSRGVLKDDDGAEHSFLAYTTYDGVRKLYRNYAFDSSGELVFTDGRYDAKSRTMIWTTVDPKTRNRVIIYDRFAEKERIESTAQVKTLAGQVVFKQQATSRRVKDE